MKKILFVERKFWVKASIEKVFRQIAGKLSPDKFEFEFQTLKYGNTLGGLIRNLLFFRKQDADIYHITGHVHYVALLLPPEKTVLTVTDLIFLHNRTGIRRYFLKKIYLDLPISRVKYITAISQATKDEIVKYSGCPSEKVRVIECPMFDGFQNDTEKEFNKENPLILHIGTAENKNIERLVEALRGINCRLKIIGKIDKYLRARIEGYGLSLETDHGLDEKQMIEEYKNADIVAFCSTYEGFGLPIIEAQALRTPVVTSNIDPMKAVAGDGACLVDPFDVESIKKGILNVASNESYRTDLVKKGLENIGRFDSTSITRQYEALYLEIINS